MVYRFQLKLKRTELVAADIKSISTKIVPRIHNMQLIYRISVVCPELE